MFFEPFRGQRHVKVTDTRTCLDSAEAMRELSDDIHPEAEKIIVVLDNLNTYSLTAFYLAFEPDEARRLVKHFEFHFHLSKAVGSTWLGSNSVSCPGNASISAYQMSKP